MRILIYLITMYTMIFSYSLVHCDEFLNVQVDYNFSDNIMDVYQKSVGNTQYKVELYKLNSIENCDNVPPSMVLLDTKLSSTTSVQFYNLTTNIQYKIIVYNIINSVPVKIYDQRVTTYLVTPNYNMTYKLCKIDNFTYIGTYMHYSLEPSPILNNSQIINTLDRTDFNISVQSYEYKQYMVIQSMAKNNSSGDIVKSGLSAMIITYSVLPNTPQINTMYVE